MSDGEGDTGCVAVGGDSLGYEGVSVLGERKLNPKPAVFDSRVDTAPATARVIPFKNTCLQCGAPRAKHAKADGFCTYECAVIYERKHNPDRVKRSLSGNRGNKN